MSEMKDIVKLAVDGYKGKVEKFSVAQSQEAIRQALIEANNGKTTLNYKDIRDGKCPGLFSLIEEILSATTVAGLREDEFFNALVDFRNVAEGDQNLFVVEDSNLFVVAEAANGTQAIRRQRLGGVTETPIPTTFKAVRIYEELNRVLAGRVDFNEMIQKVSESFRQKILTDIYDLWKSATADNLGGAVYMPAAGAYDEDTLLDLIAHVEAAAGGRTATLIGTKKAIRNLAPSIMADGAKEDLYNLGYYGRFYGSPVIATPQRHIPGTTSLALDDNIITVVATGDKPIKVVYEGDPLIIMGNPADNMDLTQEYFYGEKYGAGIVLAGGNPGIGVYDMTH